MLTPLDIKNKSHKGGIGYAKKEMDAFLFSLGCYSGEPITVISHIKGGCIVSIKDARYTIDSELAEAIVI